MDRSWMVADRLSEEYEDGVEEFIRFAIKNATDVNLIPLNAEELEEHLICNEIDEKYACWTKHGEIQGGSTSTNMESSVNYSETFRTNKSDHAEQIPNAVEEDLRDCPKMFDRLKDDAKTPLYNGCTKFTILSSVLKLYNLKASNGWTDKSFTELLSLLHEMLLKDNVLPKRTYEAKQVLASIGLTHEKIHVCSNDCILFRNEYASLRKCPKCNVSRYLKKDTTPAKVVWYFPLILRLRRLFRSAENAKQMTWHAEGRIRDGKLRHPADSLQWKKFDNDHEEFAIETRNIRFALATDGMNPHGMQSSTHSTCPSGEEIFDEVKHIRITFGKPFAKQIPTAGWKKMSIFFQLSYWKSLYVRNFVDVMHVEKNVCESVISTLLNIVGKKKDGINARLDLVKLGIRSDLAPVKKGNRTFLLPTACTLSRYEKRALYETLYSVKVPKGYSSNIKSLVSLKDLKLKGLKSHDCHILIENLIPVAIQSILPKKVCMAITKLCFFFKVIYVAK
ncbi:uncharacterized protein LOC113869309 [Abrus precatorius]|uniref:Uncharacterized protein LOC113869309 n=1 Tax=Abrus precatorius TaxID=3816 RepID=A0A8B8M2G3_ABRPR|nr:uncharacterized protein LOC113869309 [Abrus precatorius]